jgi:hypothetical protein
LLVHRCAFNDHPLRLQISGVREMKIPSEWHRLRPQAKICIAHSLACSRRRTC